MGRNNPNTTGKYRCNARKKKHYKNPLGTTLQKLVYRKTKTAVKKRTSPELHNLQEADLRFITNIMRQITQKPPQEGITPSEQKYHKTYQCPTCPYKGEKEHHLIRHRQKRKCKKHGNKKKPRMEMTNQRM